MLTSKRVIACFEVFRFIPLTQARPALHSCRRPARCPRQTAPRHRASHPAMPPFPTKAFSCATRTSLKHPYHLRVRVPTPSLASHIRLKNHIHSDRTSRLRFFLSLGKHDVDLARMSCAPEAFAIAVQYLICDARETSRPSVRTRLLVCVREHSVT